jgi:hypothetical protein
MEMKGDLECAPSDLFGEPSAVHRSRFSVGGLSVQLASNQGSDVGLGPVLEPFRVATTGECEIDMWVTWAAKLPAMPGRQVFDSGTTWRLYESEAGFQFDFNAAIFGERPFKRLLIDAELRRATLRMSEECFAMFPHAGEPLDYPLDELLIMHRLTQEKGIELHGCGIVGPGGASNLFVGHSGAGKSTTTRLWAAMGGVDVLSDDRIIVRRDGSFHEDAGRARELLRRIEHDASRVPLRSFVRAKSALSQDDSAGMSLGAFEKQIPLGLKPARNDKHKQPTGIRMYGTPWHGEAVFASPTSALLGRIFVLEHGRGNVVTRLSRSQAVAELFARSFVPFHRHEYVDSALQFLEEVVEEIPCYRYAFEPTPEAVERILEFRD